MAPPGVFFSLRISQAIYAVATFALLCAVAHSYRISFNHVPWEITLAMFSSCFSLLAIVYMALRSLSPSKASNKPVIFAIYWLVSLVSLVAFICLARFLAGSSACEGALCAVTKIATVMIFFSYAVWAAATTLVGIEISKENRKTRTLIPEVKVLSDD
ncbi:hypothetical protein BDV28DRAFT_159932 [Aspergillus coremiiformis]|uniref:MARVEL domain-containing protein n=1 Tax=Aspergillus coremiiformis TaxID=138285 RepID=A0A5N6YXC0_9EURO|nr:hypothetical protein BDV28DRAFT_159932 [Aspergillus coremiiformis]